MSFEIKYNSLVELKTKTKIEYELKDVRIGIVHFCEIHPEIEFVRASISGYDYYQWEFSAELIFKCPIEGESAPILIKATWDDMGCSDEYYLEFDMNDVEYSPRVIIKNNKWYLVENYE